MAEEQPSTQSKEDISPASGEIPPKQENLFLNIGFNILIPILILNKGKQWFGSFLEPHFENVAIPVLVVALLFPISYFIYDYFKRAKYNIFSILGLISVLLTGGIGILEIPTKWFAIKEAGIPLLIGVAVVLSLKTRYPLIRTLLYNPEIIKVNLVQERLKKNKTESQFDQLLVKCTWLLAASFLLSAVLNYILARWIVVSPSGTDAFNAEVSKMMMWSWPVIVIPSMIIMMIALAMLLKGIKQMTGLGLEDVLHGAAEKSKAQPPADV